MNYADFFKANVLKLMIHASGQATGLCPLHEDRHPSFSCNLEEGLWKCHGCEKSGNVFQLAKLLGVESPEERDRVSYFRQEVACYTYEDQNGKPLLQVRRYDPKTFRQFHYDQGNWVAGLNGTDPVLYKLPLILKSPIVYITEGEKDVETLWGFGLPATCNPMGAGKWREEYSEWLRDKSIVIIPDQDEVGKNHGNDVARKLWGIAKAIKIFHLPQGKDISEWKELGGNKETLIQLVKETSILTDTDIDHFSTSKSSSKICKANEVGLSYRKVSEIESKPIYWLWKGRIARGKVSMLAGNPGLGKSQLTASMAAVVSTGSYWPVDRMKCDQGSVVILSAEDDAADTIRPRLEAAGADLNKVVIIDPAPVIDLNNHGHPKRRSFDLENDLPRLEKLLCELSDVALVVIDPITAYLGKADGNQNAEIRGLLSPLSDLAAKHGTAIVCVSHFNKAGGGESSMRVMGSLAFVAAARAAFAVLIDPDDKTRRLFLPIKNNIGNSETGLAFTVEGAEVESPNGVIETSRVLWESEIVTKTANEVLAAATEDRSGTSEATEWLRDLLTDGPMKASDAQKEARQAGIGDKALRTARERLCKKHFKREFSGGWWWDLKDNEDAQEAEDAQVAYIQKEGTLGDEGHLRCVSSEEDQTLATALKVFPGAKVVYRGPVGGWEGPQ